MSDADKLKFDKPPGIYWLKEGDGWTVARVTSEYDGQSDHLPGHWSTMVSVIGKETRWSIYYFAERTWGPKIEEPKP